MQTEWRDKTIELLKNRPVHLTYDTIAKATGIDAGWIKSFGLGKIDHPSVNRVETLYKYLSPKRSIGAF